ncbi:hypothetical protein ISCGN_021424 [Ixodes scapularis]
MALPNLREYGQTTDGACRLLASYGVHRGQAADQSCSSTGEPIAREWLTRTVRRSTIFSKNGYWLAVWTYLVAGVVALFAAICLTGPTNKPVEMYTNSETERRGKDKKLHSAT